MRVILLLLIITACTGLPKRDPVPEPPQQAPLEQPAPKRTPDRPPTIITVNPPAKPQPICVPLAVDERKRILQAFDCLLEAEKLKK